MLLDVYFTKSRIFLIKQVPVFLDNFQKGVCISNLVPVLSQDNDVLYKNTKDLCEQKIHIMLGYSSIKDNFVVELL